MKKKFYNEKYTLFIEESPTFYVPENVDVLIGDFNLNYNKVVAKQINTDTFYNGHIIVNQQLNLNLKRILDHKLSRFNIFFAEVEHFPNENVNSSIIFCSSWVLPFLKDVKFKGKELYSKCFLHRLDILELKGINVI